MICCIYISVFAIRPATNYSNEACNCEWAGGWDHFCSEMNRDIWYIETWWPANFSIDGIRFLLSHINIYIDRTDLVLGHKRREIRICDRQNSFEWLRTE